MATVIPAWHIIDNSACVTSSNTLIKNIDDVYVIRVLKWSGIAPKIRKAPQILRRLANATVRGIVGQRHSPVNYLFTAERKNIAVRPVNISCNPSALFPVTIKPIPDRSEPAPVQNVRVLMSGFIALN